ncbi:MAG: MFS transporter [Mucilaginibacter polytrichastri]|nr:MFS transporter [Mucilaginibacter polytrichastri]
MKKSLLTLTLGGLGIGITEFVMMGILPDLAKDLHISIPEAGHLISAYALGVVIGAPLLVAIAGNYPPKKILIVLMLLFAAFNGLSVFAPNYAVLFATRLLSGLPHGAFFGVGSVVASRIAEKGKGAQAVSLMFAGLTLANLAGVPLGTYIGHHFSWRYTFVIVSAVGFLTALSIKLWLPALPAAENRNLREEMSFFKSTEAWLIIGIIAIGTGGLFCWYSYIAPALTEVSKFPDDSITYILILAGAGMLVGNLIGGRLADAVSPLTATIVLLMCMTLALIINTFVAHSQTVTLIMTFFTGAIAFAMASPIQMLMINTARNAEMLAAAVSQASFNIGNALGAYFGGLPLESGYDYTSPNWVGAAMASGGAVFAILLALRTARTAKLAAA